MLKDSLRQELLLKLSCLSSEENLKISLGLTNQIVKLLHSIPELIDQIGAGYLPFKKEIAPVYQELFRNVPVNMSYPILLQGDMHFGLPQGFPKGSTWLDAPYIQIEPEWVLVPGLGFDLAGGRLGRGKGYYDRFLESHEALRIGLCWSEQILQKVPLESHDCLMDFIITEKFCWDVDQQEKF